MPVALAEGTTSIIPAETFTNLTTAVQNAASEIVTNGVSMMTTVAPYVLGLIGVSIVIGFAFRKIKLAKSA